MVETIAGTRAREKGRKFIDGAEEWIERARLAGLETAITGNDAIEFRHWACSHEVMRYSKDPLELSDDAWQRATEMSPGDPFFWWETMDGLALMLDARRSMSHLLPEVILPAVRELLNPFRDGHQMFGWPLMVEGNLPDEDIALLSLNSDRRLMESFGDVGALIFWVKPEDLAKRRFENAWTEIST